MHGLFFSSNKVDRLHRGDGRIPASFPSISFPSAPLSFLSLSSFSFLPFVQKKSCILVTVQRPRISLESTYTYICICMYMRFVLHIHMCIYMYRVYQVGAKAKTEWNETKQDNASVHLSHLLRTIWCALPLCWTSLNDLLVLLVSIFGVLKRVPLSDRTSRGCQHVGPVSQFCSARVVPQDDLPNGF